MLEKKLPLGQQSGTNPDDIKTEAQAAAYLQSVDAKIRPKSPGSNN
jgi:hypothetical protein